MNILEHRRAIMVALMALVAPLSAQAQAQPQDSDGDGVPDASDAFPCDPSRASVSYFPGDSTSALLAFEDEWPHHTDLDFNDVVVRAHYRMERNAAGSVVSLHGVFDPVAVGGDFSNGLALQLPVGSAGVSARRRVAGGAWEPLTLQPDGQATMVLSANLRELFGNTSGRINSIPGQPQLDGQRLELEVTFTPAAALSVAAAPFDVFIFRSGDLGHQIHFPQYGGTSAMNTGLFGSSQDGSTATRRFVHLSGIPAALNLMTSTRYPLEGVAVSSLFPDIVSFAASAGATHGAFYANNVVAAQGRQVSAPAVPALGAADRSCTSVGAPAGFVLVPAGSFMMGSPTSELGRNPWGPYEGQVSVTLTRSFYLGATEVTQGQWRALSGGLNPSYHQSDDSLPVERMTWWSALGYLNALSASQGLPPCYTLPSACSGSWQAGILSCSDTPAVNAASVYECTGYRLPTEAEWEYAARAGTTTATYRGNLTATNCADATLPSIAWFCGNSPGLTRPVASLLPNAWGLYDILGNVWEWSWDWHNLANPPGGIDPVGPNTGSDRVLRGGAWGNGGFAFYVRAAYRGLGPPSGRWEHHGLRAARTAHASAMSSSSRSCLEILNANPGSPDGVYEIDPDGSGPGAPRQVYCDMTTDGGGWTLVTQSIPSMDASLSLCTANAVGTFNLDDDTVTGPAKLSDAEINQVWSPAREWLIKMDYGSDSEGRSAWPTTCVIDYAATYQWSSAPALPMSLSSLDTPVVRCFAGLGNFTIGQYYTWANPPQHCGHSWATSSGGAPYIIFSTANSYGGTYTAGTCGAAPAGRSWLGGGNWGCSVTKQFVR